MILSHVTLRTLAIALGSLAKTNRIWSGKLHFGNDEDAPGRIYYSAKEAGKAVALELQKTVPGLRAVDWLEDLK
jgi:hypothetical protein